MLSLLLSGVSFSQGLIVTNLKCEGRINPLGVDMSCPEVSWQIQAPQLRNVLQTAYRIVVSDDSLSVAKNKGTVWDSKKINSAKSVRILVAIKNLKPAHKYYWRVIVWHNKDAQPVYSNIGFWQMGLLKNTDWENARWIAYNILPKDKQVVPLVHGSGDAIWGPRLDSLPYFRKTFSINKRVKSATAFVCGLGQFEMSMNGKKVGNHFLDPGWTLYSKKAQYVTFDVTKNIINGKNAVGFMLGNGFYYIPSERYRKLTGGFGYPKLIARIVINYKDGSVENIITDDTWKADPSPITFSSIYGGEDYNANLEQQGWNSADFDDARWKQVLLTDGPSLLVSQMEYPVEMFDTFHQIKKISISNNTDVYDLGQNFAGIPFVKVSGKKGDTIRITPSELIYENGTPNQNSSGGPHYDNYVLNGEGIEWWHPRFSYYGFRYLQIERLPSNKEQNELPEIKEVSGIHIHNAAPRVSSFECSNLLFNKIDTLIRWAITSNMMSVFTDCPHREKLGWLEESHLMGSSVHYNFDVAALNNKVVHDMMDSQTKEGLVADIAPEYVHFESGFRDSPEWGSALIILPWYNYRWYGNKRLLEQAYTSMKKYVQYLEEKSIGHIVMQGLGDWVDLGPNPPGESQLTPRGLTGTATFYYDLNIMDSIAKLLKHPDDAIAFEKKARIVKDAFNKKFFDEKTKNYGTGSQAANAMALYMNLVQPPYRKAVLNNLVNNIRERNNSLSAGDIGYRYVLQALQDAGRQDVIFDMNSRSDVPGYGYQLAKGATALLESWDAQPSLSQNHFMLGHIMEWFYSGLCGISQAKDGIAYNKIVIRPQPAGDIRFAKASFNSPYGVIKSDWNIDNGFFNLNVTIPANTTAEIILPDGASIKSGSGSYSYKARW
ncbi:MAG: glycoside hydrolase family 78 protein [Bacteroidetes bacterium]|nr:glycoside hydrolase family 78 protein [Bacteroidota bacterium]